MRLALNPLKSRHTVLFLRHLVNSAYISRWPPVPPSSAPRIEDEHLGLEPKAVYTYTTDDNEIINHKYQIMHKVGCGATSTERLRTRLPNKSIHSIQILSSHGD
ncbi:hypothetical protein N7467_012203 [Penicillium canescens]|nr:hypothetical protein N7467_012203 [Penicillium canescens]